MDPAYHSFCVIYNTCTKPKTFTIPLISMEIKSDLSLKEMRFLHE